MPILHIEINKCGDCPKVASEPIYTADSFDRDEAYFCKLVPDGQTRNGYKKTFESKVPGWCPLRADKEEAEKEEELYQAEKAHQEVRYRIKHILLLGGIVSNLDYELADELEAKIQILKNKLGRK